MESERKTMFPNATPRPWFAINCGTAEEPMMSVKAARIAGRKPGHEVAMCATGDSPQAMETDNCKLIVHAVNNFDALYETLEALVDAATAEVNEKGAGGYMLARLSDARAALAAASGVER